MAVAPFFADRRRRAALLSLAAAASGPGRVGVASCFAVGGAPNLAGERNSRLSRIGGREGTDVRRRRPMTAGGATGLEGIGGSSIAGPSSHASSRLSSRVTNALVRSRTTPSSNARPLHVSSSTLRASSAAGDDDAASDLSARGGGGSADERETLERVPMWPCFDELDRNLIKISVPCIANFAINPLIGAVDLFWINRMGNALAVAGQAAANQVFNSAFWIFSFLPSVTATLVSKVNAEGDEEGLQDAVCQALVVGFVVAMMGFGMIFLNPEKVLSAVLPDGSKAMEFAKPYLLIRSFSFLPNLTSLIGYSAFRGVLDTVTPMKISAFANIFNALLDPVLIFPFKMGVTGAALATLAAEIISAVTFMRILLKRNMIRWSKLFRIPDWSKLKPLLKGGLALQLRNFALNLTFLAVTRVTQSIDDTGVAAAAHALAIQTFQVGGIVLLALSTVAQTVVPNEMIEKIDPATGKKTGGVLATKAVVNRLMSWGFILGGILGGVQLAILPFLLKSSPLEEVRQVALIPSYLASVYQLINGLVFIGEGVMVGCGNFLQLSLSTLVATGATLQALKTFPKTYGITGVW
eukprot:CAMPEP_0113584562 /NCGR_PEP_ID=MMETSP0015_2-20120614/33176_1 /TAXON_ID=2838 /ORGANISM="Odontella" /LENGTH=580 /DNA_ID=CAMNT_0000489633 /DNA_START=183 /DNA_END=1922 /DNA_ORIENTATION=- /assembly_acc=CAM_ASM_000160